MHASVYHLVIVLDPAWLVILLLLAFVRQTLVRSIYFNSLRLVKARVSILIPVYRISAPTSMPHAAGVGEKYLTKYFRDFPEHDHSQLKIGHVLHLYFQNERSVAKTMHAFAQRLNLRCSPRQIRRVTVDVLKRFKHLSRQTKSNLLLKFATNLSHRTPLSLMKVILQQEIDLERMRCCIKIYKKLCQVQLYKRHPLL